MIKIGILGADGSMGRRIISKSFEDDNIEIMLAYSEINSPNIGTDIGVIAGQNIQSIEIKSIESLNDDLKKEKPDIFVDFTIAEATEKIAFTILGHAIPLVIGTTGLSENFMDKIKRISDVKKIPLVISSNMSIGMNVIFKFAADLANRLKDWEIEIIETHHHRKQDVPSGTALTIVEKIMEKKGLDKNSVPKIGRQKGKNPRKWGDDEIGIHSVRGGDITGDHVILYAGDGERIELKHQVHSRDTFAIGALKAAKFLFKHKNEPKIYNMFEVLGI